MTSQFWSKMVISLKTAYTFTNSPFLSFQSQLWFDFKLMPQAQVLIGSCTDIQPLIGWCFNLWNYRPWVDPRYGAIYHWTAYMIKIILWLTKLNYFYSRKKLSGLKFALWTNDFKLFVFTSHFYHYHTYLFCLSQKWQVHIYGKHMYLQTVPYLLNTV